MSCKTELLLCTNLILVHMLSSDLYDALWLQVVQEALDKAKVTVEDLSAVAVTIGPGLSLCLRGNILLSLHFPPSVFHFCMSFSLPCLEHCPCLFLMSQLVYTLQ